MSKNTSDPRLRGWRSWPILRSAVRYISGGLVQTDRDWGAFYGWGPTAAGEDVSEETAIRHATVHACARVLAESMLAVGLKVYRRNSDGTREETPNLPAAKILRDAVNPEMAAGTFREAAQLDLALWGNGYAEIERDNAGRILGLHYRRAAYMRPERMNGRIVYRYSDPRSREVVLDASDVFHVRNMGDGTEGWSPIRMARESIGLGLGAERYGAEIFSNDARPAGHIRHPGEMSDPAYGRLKDSWKAKAGDRHAVNILEEGAEFHVDAIPPEDAQFLETRKYNREEICGLYRVSPHLVQDLSHGTYSNIRELGREFITYTMLPWFVRWEMEINRVFFSGTPYYAKFNADAFTRGDSKTRYETYRIGRTGGWLSVNDIRRLEDMNPLEEGGDVYLVPLNMADAKNPPPPPSAQPAEKPNGSDVDGDQPQPEPDARALHAMIEATLERFAQRERNAVPKAAAKRIPISLSDWRSWSAEWYAREAAKLDDELRKIASAFSVRSSGLSTGGRFQMRAEQIQHATDPADVDVSLDDMEFSTISLAILEQMTQPEGE